MFNLKGNVTIEFETLSKELGELATGSQITRYFQMCGLTDALGEGTTKYKRISNSFAFEINIRHDDSKIISFIEIICNPVKFISTIEFNNAIDKLNRILIFMGCKVNANGKVYIVPKASSLNDALERTNRMKSELDKRIIHPLVMKYCSREYLTNDYFHACFESVKGLFDRIRSFTGRTEDGNELLDKVFKKEAPLLIINSHSTVTEKDEFIGLKNLLLFLHKSVRNSEAHNTRLNHEVELERTLDIFACVSLANKYLDKAQTTCFTYSNK